VDALNTLENVVAPQQSSSILVLVAPLVMLWHGNSSFRANFFSKITARAGDGGFQKAVAQLAIEP
jgi:hypothetical protein